MADLEADLRKVMAPHTAPRLRESKRNVLRDFVHIAGPLGVTHFLILTATQRASYLRIAKSPRVRGAAHGAASTSIAHVYMSGKVCCVTPRHRDAGIRLAVCATQHATRRDRGDSRMKRSQCHGPL